MALRLVAFRSMFAAVVGTGAWMDERVRSPSLVVVFGGKAVELFWVEAWELWKNGACREGGNGSGVLVGGIWDS